MPLRGSLIPRAAALLATAGVLYWIVMPAVQDEYVATILAGLLCVMLAPFILDQKA